MPNNSAPTSSLPAEFDLPADFGFTMRGWDFSSQSIRQAIAGHRLMNPAMELGSNICPWNCDFCFTESPDNPDGRKHRLIHELSIERRLKLIDEAAAIGAKSINFVGAGEPTIDPHFWELVEKMAACGITPIIYTEGSLKLTSKHFAERLFNCGATVVLKMNSLSNWEYQDKVLRGIRPKSGVPTASYSAQRQKALEVLIDCGFNETVPTRLAFDTIICRENAGEIEELHRYARLNNIFVLLVNYLPSGRTKDGHTSAITWEEQKAIFARLAVIDEKEFRIRHGSHFPYAGGVPCTIRGLGLFVKIQGEVFDCPGESVPLGNLENDSLETIWNRAREITAKFDGGCLPRQLFWQRLAKQADLAKSTGESASIK
jgi:MoaA/NifB/PqqE/SkfB family radical SAM enzyme